MPISYTVHRGDNLWTIAQHEYGDGSKFGLIADASGIAKPWIVYPGDTIVIPPLHAPVPVP